MKTFEHLKFYIAEYGYSQLLSFFVVFLVFEDSALGTNPSFYSIKQILFLQVGQAIHVGGLLRLDLNEASVETIYITVWVSPSVSLHLGKIENADDFWRNHVGVRLQVKL